VLLLGVEGSAERARLLGLGFGDDLSETPTLREVEPRATRIALRIDMLPGPRRLHPGQAAGLDPREFALFWRLADTPGVAVAKHVLLTEIWSCAHTRNQQPGDSRLPAAHQAGGGRA
jgi:DNA-binding response OmpR family regulator